MQIPNEKDHCGTMELYLKEIEIDTDLKNIIQSYIKLHRSKLPKEVGSVSVLRYKWNLLYIIENLNNPFLGTEITAIIEKINKEY